VDGKSEEDRDSILGTAFWCSAPIPLIAIFLGFVLTPEQYYDEIFGFINPVAVYGLTGFFAAASTFLSAVLLLFPLQLRSLTFKSRFRIVLIISACACAAAIYFGLKVMSRQGHVVY